MGLSDLSTTAGVTRPLAPSIDVTAESGYSVTGRLSSWITRSGSVTTEHLAGTTATSHLIHFYWSPALGRWWAQDLTALTGHAVTGDVTTWITPDGPYTVEHVAGRTQAGRLLVFFRSTRNTIWQVVDVTTRTGRSVAGGLTSWQTPDGPYLVEHLAARDAAGRLVVFWWSPAADWQAVDVTALTGHSVRSDITSWQLWRGTRLYEYLAATSATDNAIIVFSWAPGEDWQAQRTFQVSADGATPWLVGDVEHLAGVHPDGMLFVLWRQGTGSWQRVDVTAITGERAIGRPTAYQLMDGAEWVEFLGARSPNGRALVYWWKPSRDWQAIDLTEITGYGIVSPPEAWVMDSGAGYPSEHLAAVGTDGRLRVFYSYDQPRTLTDRVGEGYAGIRRMRNTQRRVLAVLWDPRRPEHPAPPAAAIDSLLFGPTNSVRDYFRENSGGAFAMERAGALGWFVADHPADYYWNPRSVPINGFLNGHVEKWTEAILKADPYFNFAAYDTNGNRVIEPEELAILIVIPQNGPFGTALQSPAAREVPVWQPLVVDGVEISLIAEAYIGAPPNLGVVAHELSHLVLGLPDMYAAHDLRYYFTPTAPGMYSLMDDTYSGTHIDPFNKLKLGWAHPRIIFRSGRYTVPDVETRHRVLVLMDPVRSTSEYFLIENRWRGTSYDRVLPDQGLGVWHIMEEPAVFEAALPPVTVDLNDWLRNRGDWGRWAIRMVRPVLTPPLDDGRALWDASESDLLPDHPDPLRPALRWGNGTPSGFALRCFSTAGPSMHITIQVPSGPYHPVWEWLDVVASGIPSIVEAVLASRIENERRPRFLPQVQDFMNAFVQTLPPNFWPWRSTTALERIGVVACPILPEPFLVENDGTVGGGRTSSYAIEEDPPPPRFLCPDPAQTYCPPWAPEDWLD